MEDNGHDSSSFENPCDLVRITCRAWMEDEGLVDGADNENDAEVGSRSVRIRLDKLSELADEIAQKASTTESSWIQWDEEGWHYNGEGFEGTAAEKKERVALYLLALDAINFCFWPLDTESSEGTATNSLEYDHLAMAMKKMAEEDHGNSDIGYVFSPQNLASMDADKMTNLFESCLDHPLPNIQKRSSLWKEVGEILLEDFQGSATVLLEAADNDASKLVECMATSFQGFRDEVYTRDGQRIVFLKRAQIFVGDANAALNLDLLNMNKLTTFADYRVPQILRHKGALEYSPCLAAKVDQLEEITKSSSDEISIRAATVLAVEKLVGLLNQKISPNAAFSDVTVDWYLWQVGERMNQEGTMKPFHRIRTHFY
mmetsp:Transcript_8353/g.20542  ORF Transcript_8353/g.20542 Transcript_8353/m.20542 type:complete len:372 (+) Transcript_8353:59-1174(+)